MKPILALTIGALLSGSAFSQHPTIISDAGTSAESVKQKTRRVWVKAKAYLSEDKAAFMEGAQQTLTDLAMEIDTVAAKVGVVAPAYFLTRLQSLRQHHEYLRLKLRELTDEAIKTRLSGPRYAFDKCVGSLEAAIEQAGDEAELLGKLYSPAKLEAKQ